MPPRDGTGPYSGVVLALTLDQAKTIAVVVAAVLVALALLSAWIMKTIVQKVALVVILGLLAFAVWTQRTSLDECADKVRAEARADVARRTSTSCRPGRHPSLICGVIFRISPTSSR